MSVNFNPSFLSFGAATVVAPIIQSFTSNTTTTSATFTPTAPSGTVAGDLIICNIGTTAGRYIKYFNGWTEIDQNLLNNVNNQHIVYIIATGSTLPTLTFSGNAAYHASTYRITGHNPAAPIDQANWAYDGTVGLTLTVASVTPSVDKTLMLAMFAANSNVALSTVDNSMTIDVQNSTAWSSHNTSKTLTSMAATGSVTATWPSVSTGRLGCIITICPVGETPDRVKPRYWVGGSGNWTETNTANWSATSGGAGGASVPTKTNSVFWDNNSSSGNYTVGIDTPASWQTPCLDFTTTAPASGNLTFNSTGRGIIQVYGNCSLYSGTLFTGVASVPGAGQPGSFDHFYMFATAPSTLRTNGVRMVSIFGIWAETSVTLLDPITCGDLVLSKGDFNDGGQTITCRCVTFNQVYDRSIHFGACTWNIVGPIDLTNTMGWNLGQLGYNVNFYLPANPNDSIINVTCSDAGGILLGYDYTSTGTRKLGHVKIGTTGAGWVNVASGFTCETLEITGVARTLKCLQVSTLKINAKTWLCGGTAGNLNVFAPYTAATAYKLDKTGGGTVNMDYLSISYANATPTPSVWFVGTHSTDGGSNTGLSFT